MKLYKPEGLEEEVNVKGDFKPKKKHSNGAVEMDQQ